MIFQNPIGLYLHFQYIYIIFLYFVENKNDCLYSKPNDYRNTKIKTKSNRNFLIFNINY